jgi:hypothetical protein
LERREEFSSFAVDFNLNHGGLAFYRSLACDDWQLCLHDASGQKWRNKDSLRHIEGAQSHICFVNIV